MSLVRGQEKKEILSSQKQLSVCHTCYNLPFTPSNLFAMMFFEHLSQQAKAIKLLRPFCIAIEKRHPSKYSCCDKNGEREKKTMFVIYRGRFALIASFYLHFNT